MERRYLSAVDVVPMEQLEALSKLLEGRSALLWIPSLESLRRERRNTYIERLSKEGNTEEEIADRVFLSPRTIRRVMARRKTEANRSPSKRDP